MLNGLCHAATHPVSAALISDHTEVRLRKTAFHLRYFAINVGASVGPFFGASLLLKDPSLGFYLTAAVYLVYWLACALWLPRDSKRPSGEAGHAATFRETMTAIANDPPLLYYTLAFILMGTTYAQLESTLPQYLQAAQGDAGVKLFGLLMGVNALSVVTLQIPLTRVMRRLSLLGTVKAGSGVYGMGLALFGVVGQSRLGMILAMVILTMGEVLIFSNGNLLIDQIAPEDKKGAYFGASGLWALGATFGPAFGGYLMVASGGQALFFVMGAIGIANGFVYGLGHRARAK